MISKCFEILSVRDNIFFLLHLHLHWAFFLQKVKLVVNFKYLNSGDDNDIEEQEEGPEDVEDEIYEDNIVLGGFEV